MSMADINGIRYNYEIEGKGDPIVLISGYGGDANFWKRAIELLSERFMVITVDNRGSGKTECDLEFSIDDMADDIASLLDHLSIDNANILGWSMGSHVAQNLGIRHPEKVRTLILVSTYGYRPSRSAYILNAALSAIEKGAPDELFGHILNGLIYTEDFFNKKEKEQSDIKISSINDAHKLRAQFKAIDLSNTADRASSIIAPTLCIHGTKDIMVEICEGEKIANKIQNCKFIKLDGEGHLISPRLYIPRVIEFIEDHS
jgi:3-oxoadipate enol-lactonase